MLFTAGVGAAANQSTTGQLVEGTAEARTADAAWYQAQSPSASSQSAPGEP